MNYLDKLLQGEKVEWRTLGEVVDISNIGVDKKINANEQKVRLLNFVDVFKNQYVSNKTPTMVVTASERKIIDCEIKNEDIFITPSSELIDEIGFSAMAVEDFDNAVYSYHIMRLRINDKNTLYPAYLNFLFSSTDVRKQIQKKAQGITRYGLTQPNWKSIQIPIPPLAVQKKIVAILDKFTELTAELTARKQQYSFYSEQLLSFEEGEVVWKTLGEVVNLQRGRRLVKSQLEETGKYAVYQNAMTPLGYYHLSNVKAYTTFVICAGAAGEIGFSDVDFWAADDVTYCITPDFINNKFVYYYLQTQLHKINSQVRRASIPRLSKNVLEKLVIPVPLPEEQERIVSILDKFDTLTTSITEGLPKEIELRKKQYEYYREQLLTFPLSEAGFSG